MESVLNVLVRLRTPAVATKSCGVSPMPVLPSGTIAKDVDNPGKLSPRNELTVPGTPAADR